MFFKSILIATFMVLYLTNFCEAIQCYFCESTLDQSCGIDKFEPKDSFKRNCDTEPRPALKPNAEKPTKCSVLVEKSGQFNVTHRGCLWKNKDENADCYKENNQNTIECKSCDSDFCNSAPKIFNTIGATIFMCVVGFFLH